MKLTRDPAEVRVMAIALALTYGWRVFPVRLVPKTDGTMGKIPTIKEWQLRASADPDEIARMWRSAPGDLIGVLCGDTSGIDVVDIDSPRHAEARAWWRINEPRLPVTRSYRSLSGGIHLFFRHAPGLGTSAAKLCPGLDVRASGGLAVFWYAHGCECLDHSPLADFPSWLFEELTWTPTPPPPSARPINPDRAIDGVLRFLSEAREGTRNGRLFWSACRLVDHGLGHNSALSALLPIALNIGLSEPEARQTIASAQRRERRAA
jgi:hypothetical protein